MNSISGNGLLPERSKSVGVIVVDYYPATRLGTGQSILTSPELRLLGEAATPDEAAELAETIKPDVIVTELDFPRGPSGIDVVEHLAANCASPCGVLVYTTVARGGYPERCIKAGARGFVGKAEPLGNLVRAIEVVATGKVYLSESVAGEIVSRLVNRKSVLAESPVDELSPSEFRVLALIGKGLSNGDIARSLHRSIKTIETYRSRIKRKLSLENSTQLAQFAAMYSA